ERESSTRANDRFLIIRKHVRQTQSGPNIVLVQVTQAPSVSSFVGASEQEFAGDHIEIGPPIVNFVRGSLQFVAQTVGYRYAIGGSPRVFCEPREIEHTESKIAKLLTALNIGTHT